MIRRRTQRLWLAAMAVVLATAVGACGGGGHSDSDNPVLNTSGVTTLAP